MCHLYFRHIIVRSTLRTLDLNFNLKCPAHSDINVEVKGTLEQPCSRPTRSMLNPTFVSSQDGDEEQIKLCYHHQEQHVDNGQVYQDDQDAIYALCQMLFLAFLAVQNSSIGDLVPEPLTESLSE